MALSERLAILITGDSKDAVQAFQNVGKAADTDLVKAEKGLDRVGARMQSMGAQAVAAGAVMATGLYQAVLSTQDLADSWDKARATFGEGDNGLVQYAEDGAVAMGKSKAAALDAASAYGLLLKGTGLSAPDLTKTSTDLAVRTADLAEAYKKPFEDANAAIESAIKTGSSKALKGLLEYDIAISDLDVKNEAVVLGIAKQGEALDRQQKSLAVSSLIMKQSTDVAGTYKGSLDDVGVQIDVMRAQWENAKASFGEASLPVFTELATKASDVLATFNDLDESSQGVVGGLAAVAAGALLTGGAISVLAGSYLRLKAAQDAASGGASFVGPGAVAGLAVAVGAQEALNNAIGNEQAEAIDKAIVSQDRFAKALATNDMRAFEAATRDAAAAASEGPDPGKWEQFRNVLRGALADLSGTEAVLPQIFAGDDADRELAQLNAQLDVFKNGLVGLDPENAKQQIATFIDGLEGGKIPAEELAKLQKELNDEFANTAPSADIATKAVTGLGEAASRSAVPGLNELASALDRAGVPLEQVDAILAQLDPTTANASVTLQDFAAVAEAAGIPLDQLGAALDAAGVKVDTFASKQAAASAKIASASNLVIGYERALLRQEKAQKNLDGLADKQADDLRSANDAVEDATDAVTDAIKRRTKAQQTLNELNKKSAVAGSVPLLQEITRAAAEMETQAQAAARVAEATYGVGSDQAITANRAAQDAARRREQAGGFLNQALSEQQGRNAQERADAADAVADADKAVSRASRDRADAQKQVDQTLANAATERKEAELDLIESTLGTVDAYGRLQAAVQDGAAPVDTLRDGLKQAFDQGIITADTFRQLSGVLDGMTGSAVSLMMGLAGGGFGAVSAAYGGYGAVYGQGYGAGGFGAATSAGGGFWTPEGFAMPGSNSSSRGMPVSPVTGGRGQSKTTTVNNYNITTTDPLQTAAEIAKRNKLAILERKLGR